LQATVVCTLEDGSRHPIQWYACDNPNHHTWRGEAATTEPIDAFFARVCLPPPAVGPDDVVRLVCAHCGEAIESDLVERASVRGEMHPECFRELAAGEGLPAEPSSLDEFVGTITGSPIRAQAGYVFGFCAHGRMNVLNCGHCQEQVEAALAARRIRIIASVGAERAAGVEVLGRLYGVPEAERRNREIMGRMRRPPVFSKRQAATDDARSTEREAPPAAMNIGPCMCPACVEARAPAPVTREGVMGPLGPFPAVESTLSAAEASCAGEQEREACAGEEREPSVWRVASNDALRSAFLGDLLAFVRELAACEHPPAEIFYQYVSVAAEPERQTERCLNCGAARATGSEWRHTVFAQRAKDLDALVRSGGAIAEAVGDDSAKKKRT
jgi:hypothetical protein